MPEKYSDRPEKLHVHLSWPNVNELKVFTLETIKEVCNLSKRDLQSLDFTINRFFLKLFCILLSTNVRVELPSDIIKKRSVKFESTCDILSVS